MPVISGTAYWASVHKPNTTYDPKWTIELIVDKDEAAKFKSRVDELKETGKENTPAIKKDEEKGGYSIRVDQRVEQADGSPNQPPRVIDLEGQPFDELIGNGSQVEVLYNLGRSTYKNKTYIKAYLRAVKVIEHVPYKSNDPDAEDFFKASPKAGKAKPQADDDFDDDLPEFN